MALMNTIYAMSQFVVVIHVLDENSTTLVSYCMHYTLMKFGICHLIMLNYGISFKEWFIAMYQDLNLNCDIFAKRDYKGITVEHIYRF